MKIPIIKLRWSWDCLVFLTEIPIHGKTAFILRQGECVKFTDILTITQFQFSHPTSFGWSGMVVRDSCPSVPPSIYLTVTGHWLYWLQATIFHEPNSYLVQPVITQFSQWQPFIVLHHTCLLYWVYNRFLLWDILMELHDLRIVDFGNN